jgi:hypothetical protein
MILSPRSWNLMRWSVLRGVDELGDRVVEHTVQLLLCVAELLVAVVVRPAEPSPTTMSWMLSPVLILCVGGQLWQVAHPLVILSTRTDLPGQMIRCCPGRPELRMQNYFLGCIWNQVPRNAVYAGAYYYFADISFNN